MIDTEYHRHLQEQYRSMLQSKLDDDRKNGITINPLSARRSGGRDTETVMDMVDSIKNKHTKPAIVETIIESAPEVVYKKQRAKVGGGGVEMEERLLGMGVGGARKATARSKKQEVDGAVHGSAPSQPQPQAPLKPRQRKAQDKISVAKETAKKLPKGQAMANRAALAKKLMKEHGWSLIEASKQIKAQNMTY